MKSLFPILLSCFMLLSCEKKHESTPTIDAPKMEWWEDARLGMFIHWGLYSVWEGNYQGVDVNGNNINFEAIRDGGGAGAEWMQRNAKIPTDIYLARLSEFNSRNFDTDKIAQLAKDAGMKYIIITSKHHEGVCLWDSKHDPINISKSGADVNILKKLKKSCTDRGLKFGVYFSQNLDWSIKGGFGQDYYATYTKKEHEEYVDKYVLPVLDELFTNLDPDILWWDIPSGNPYPDLADKINAHIEQYGSKKLITNDRLSSWHKGDAGTGEGDFYDGEGYGENCVMMNRTWGYSSSHEAEEYYESPYGIIFTSMVGSVARGQNCLINVGPKGDGSIPARQLERLNIVADWMAVNKSAITGSTRVLQKSNPQWGRLTQNKKKNELFLVVGTNTTSIYLDGIKTDNLTSIKTAQGVPVKYEILSNDRVSIPNFRGTPQNDLPMVLVAKYSSSVEVLDYTFVSDKMSCYAFWGDGINARRLRIESNGALVMAAWWDGKITSRIKFNGESGEYKVIMNVDQFQWGKQPQFAVTIGSQESSLRFTNRDDQPFDQIFKLTKGQIYDVTLSKTDAGQSWTNFTHLQFQKQ